MQKEITISVIDVAYEKLKKKADKEGISIEELAEDIIEIWSMAQIAIEVRRDFRRANYHRGTVL